MAEQEVLKHTKIIYKIWHSKDHNFWHKVKEFLIEIAIIVFAVTISIWFHNRSEHQHQQADAKEFLLGLREDLTNDLKEMTGDRVSYMEQEQVFKYVTNIQPNQKLNADSMNNYMTQILSTTGLSPNNGRYEGFKSSGKIGTIEDKKLQNDIVDLYQENIPTLMKNTDFYNSRKEKLLDYYIKNGHIVNGKTVNLVEIMMQVEPQNTCNILKNTSQIVGRYDSCIVKMTAIVTAIEKNYSLKK